jgi:DNA-binding transcriptional LysR family regulator
MQFFVRTVELGSLTAVAREFGTTQPTVSKVIAQLEAQLNVRLLERSTKGPVPTEHGLRFYDHAKVMTEHYEAAVGEIQGASGQPAGFLRIHAPVGLGQFRVNALVQEFMRLYPGIGVELVLDDRFADLVEEGIDIALRLAAAGPVPNAVGRHLAVVPRFLVAAPAYLALHGAPLQPDDLAAHDFVRFAASDGNAGNALDLARAGERVRVQTRSRYRINNALAIRDALAAGGGIGLCPEWLVRDLLDEISLVRVLPEWWAMPQDLYLLYPSRRYQPLRAKLFVQFVADRFSVLPGFRPPSEGVDSGLFL